MGVEIKGINSLLSKLNKLSNIEAKEAVTKVASEVEEHIRENASVFSDKGVNCIGSCEVRDDGTSYFVDVGIKNDSAPWEEWKGLYFHQYGYWHKYFGKPTGKYINMHQLWFTDAINSVEKESLTKIKRELRQQIKTCWGPTL